MAKIIPRVWTSRGPTGKKTCHVSYGYDVRIAGQGERTVSTEWTTEAQALDPLTTRLKDQGSKQMLLSDFRRRMLPAYDATLA